MAQLLDRTALAANSALHESSRYDQVGVDAGNGWQRQENGGVWGGDWLEERRQRLSTSW